MCLLASHNIAKSKTGSKEMQGIHFDQDVQVCRIFSNPIFFLNSFVMNLIFSRKYGEDGLCFFSLFFGGHLCTPFSLMPFGMDIIFFCIAQIPFGNFERDHST